MYKKFQQQGNMTRGNPLFEQIYGQMMKGLMPKGVASPKQMSQGGMGGMAKFAMGHGYSKNRFSGKSSLKKFLMQYSNTGKVKVKGINLNKLLKF